MEDGAGAGRIDQAFAYLFGVGGFRGQLQVPGQVLAGVRVTDTLPAQTSLEGAVAASSGSAAVADGQITWHGDVHAAVGVTLTYSLRLDGGIAAGAAVDNSIQIDDGAGDVLERAATIIVGGQPLHLPFVRR